MIPQITVSLFLKKLNFRTQFWVQHGILLIRPQDWEQVTSLCTSPSPVQRQAELLGLLSWVQVLPPMGPTCDPDQTTAVAIMAAIS